MEVKGTTGQPDKFLLTSGEVEHAGKHPRQTILFIVYDICLDKNILKASGGKKRILKPWCPEAKDLEATAYRYTLPEKQKR